MVTKDIGEIELDLYSEILFSFTKATAETGTSAFNNVFAKVVREVWQLLKSHNHLASEEAYKQFFNMTQLDIRKYNWFSKVKDKNNNVITVHNYFQDEHLTTVFDFANTLINCYENKTLTVDLIKEMILQQRMCWITKEENKRLNDKDYRKHRANPLDAYKECGIKIYDPKKDDINNVMKPNFLMGNKKNRSDFFSDLKSYFENNFIDGSKFILITDASKWNYAQICDRKGLKINVRVNDGLLNDVCAYIHGKNAKKIFDELIKEKDEIEKEIGAKLVWDRNNDKQATRISRFGKYSKNFNQSDEDDEFFENIESYDFDLDVEKVAIELAKFYKVFWKRVDKIVEELK